MLTRLLFAFVLALCLPFTTANSAVAIHLEEKGITLDNGPEAKFEMAWPVLVTTEKAKVEIVEKTITAQGALLKFNGGGQLAIVAENGEINIKLSAVPPNIQFLLSYVTVGANYAGSGKWRIGGKENTFPLTQAANATLYSGNADSFVLGSASGVTTAISVPPFTYQQIQDLRQWGKPEFRWQFWTTLEPGKDTYVIKVGDSASASQASASPQKPATAPKTALATSGGTSVMKWRGGKEAAFLLAFDDTCPSHLTNAIPELEKRSMVGTFYVVTGNDLWNGRLAKWQKAAESPSVVLANHTFTHQGVNNAQELDQELSKCNDQINRCCPNSKLPRLIGFGTPGGVPWKVTKEEFTAALKKHNLVNRPSFYGPPLNVKTLEASLAVIDSNLKKGEMGHLDFHGVGGDWHITPMDWFIPILDKLDAEKERLWITDLVSWHQYVTERDGAVLDEHKSDGSTIRVKLTTTTDPAFYDMPLTLVTKVPAAWTTCTITQGADKKSLPVVQGRVQYEARPGGEEIILTAN